MKFVFKGKYVDESQLTKIALPENAVKYDEPKNIKDLERAAVKYIKPTMIFVTCCIIVKFIILKNYILDFNLYLILGAICSYLMVIPHELLHGLFFPRGAIVEIWYSVKPPMAFVYCPMPVPKNLFIFISILPNLVFGFIPLMVWTFLPKGFLNLSNFLFTFGTFSAVMGVGDYLNINNTIKQVPRGGMTQLWGFNSYWFIKE